MLNVVAVLVLLLPQQDRIRELIEQLRADSSTKRNEATLELKKIGASAVPLLEAAARDSDLEVATRARQALAAIALRSRLTPGLLERLPGIEDRLASGGDRAATKEFLKAYDTVSLRPADLECLAPAALRGAVEPEDFDPVMSIIGRYRIRSALFELLDRIESPEQHIRWSAYSALAGVGGEQVSYTPSGDVNEDQIVRVAAGMLPKVDPAGLEARLMEGLKSPRDWRRRIAIRGLAMQGRRGALPDILRFERSDDPGTRADVLFAIGELGTMEEAGRVIDALNDPSTAVRAAAVLAAAKLRDERVVPRVLALLPGSDDDLQIAACRALAEFRTPGALPALIRIYSEGLPQARRAAEVALTRYDPKDVAVEMVRVIAGQPLNVRVRAVGLLGSIDAAGAAPALEELLSTDDSVELRIEVLKSLSRFHSVPSAPKIRPLLSHPNARLQATAARTLAELGDDGVAAKLVELLADADWNARYNAVVGLAALDAKDHAPKLVPLALSPKDPEWVRTAALKALEKLGGAGEARALAPLLDDVNYEIRTAAVKVLASMGVPAAVKGVLTETQDFIGLNGVKEPEAWTRARQELATEDLQGTLQEVLEHLAAALGRTVVWTEDLGNREVDPRAPRSLAAKGRRKTLLEAFREVLPVGVTLVFEKETIRVITHEQALEFWPKWRENGPK